MSTYSYNLTSTTSDPIDSIDTVLINERSRLLAKKDQIDKATYNQTRLQGFNESFRKRYAFYNSIMVYIVIILLIYLGIVLLKKYVPIIPESLLDIITVILFAVAIIYTGMQVNELYSRDNMNFDKINYSGGNMISPEELAKKKQQAADSGDLSAYSAAANANKCIGQACCATGMTWSESLNQCTYGNVSGFTNINESFTSSILVNGSVSPYSPSEFDSYGKI
jgi:hypothetical protein